MTSLLRAGHEVVRLRDAMPVRSPDPAVIAKAQVLGCILLSLNGDFCDIVTYPPADFGGIIAIQLRNHPETILSLMTRLLAYINAHPNPRKYVGRLLVVEVHRIRTRT